jgi:hypothetical protein
MHGVAAALALDSARAGHAAYYFGSRSTSRHIYSDFSTFSSFPLVLECITTAARGIYHRRVRSILWPCNLFRFSLVHS